MMKELRFTLKQHTPLLHFQYEQERATLRVSEVKPKLDRYIVEKEFENDFQKCKRFLIGYGVEQEKVLENKFLEGYRALNYKMRIWAVDPAMPENPNPEIVDKNGKKKRKISPMYFGNMGDGDVKYYVKSPSCKGRVWIKEELEELLEIIVKHIGTFFYTRNFGTRQTKGFGSFTIISSSSKIRSVLPTLSFTVEGDRQRLFEEMEWIYKALRSGINDQGRSPLYFKSLMFAYAKSQGNQWDKKSIKEAFVGRAELNRQQRAHEGDLLRFSSPTHYDYRDCLGLSSLENWRYYHMTVRKSSPAMERFASPIVFKPIEKEEGIWRVYIIYSEIPECLKGAEVHVSAGNNNQVTLTIPRDFSVKAYMDFVFKQNDQGEYAVDLEELFLEDGNWKKKERILEIFKELRLNYNKES